MSTSLEGGTRKEPEVKAGGVHRIVTTALDQPVLVAVLTIALIGVGIWSLLRLPVDAYPDISPPRVEIVTQWPGHAAEEIERLITVPVETETNGLAGLTVTRSISLYGLSNVRLTFEDGTVGDVDFAGREWRGVFEPLNDPAEFARVEVDPEAGTITWPGGLDMAPQPLYAEARRRRVQGARAVG